MGKTHASVTVTNVDCLLGMFGKIGQEIRLKPQHRMFLVCNLGHFAGQLNVHGVAECACEGVTGDRIGLSCMTRHDHPRVPATCERESNLQVSCKIPGKYRSKCFDEALAKGLN